MRRTFTIPGGAPLAAPASAPDLAALSSAADAAADYPTRLGLDGLDDNTGEEVEVTVDTDVLPTARLYSLLLKDAPPWGADLAPTGERLTKLLDRQEALAAVREAAEQADADLGDSDRWAGLEEQKLQEDLYGLLGRLLSGSDLDEAARELLRHDASEVLGLREQEQAGRQAALRQSREAKATHAAALGEADEKEQMAEVMLALRHDRPVDDATLEQALSSFSALST